MEMPGLNGYEVCAHLRKVDSTRLLPIIFLSSRSSLNERMLGYEAGGDDYLVKPCDKDELTAKINVLLRHREVKVELTSMAEEAQKTALVAMAGSSELGMALSFAEKSFALRTYKELAANFFQVTNSLSLSCCLHFKTRSKEIFFGNKGEVVPLVQQLMRMLKDQGRIVDFGTRTQINYPKVSLLVKNMPTDDQDKYGRYKDLFPFMLEASGAKILKMEAEQAMLEQSKNILMSFAMVESSLAELATSLYNNHEISAKILQDLRSELETNIPKMGLDDDQEAYLVERVDTSLVKAIEVSDSNTAVRDTFDRVLQQLEGLMEQQSTIIDDVVIGSHDGNDKFDDKPDDVDVNNSNIDLF